MSDRIPILGLTWDHPRAFDGLFAETERFNATQNEVELKWEIHSLNGFEATPIKASAHKFDLIILDHPFMGDAAASGALLDLSRYLPADVLIAARKDYIGASFESYEFGGGLWALPIDGACQVAVFRSDLMAGSEPRTFDEVLHFGQEHGLGLAMANPHAFMNFLAVAGRVGADLSGKGDRFLNQDVALYALSVLRQMARYLPQEAFDWSSIGLLEAMATTDKIAYCPMVFCFNTYCHPSSKGHLRLTYCDLPARDTTIGNRGSVLGGAGIAVSASCAHLEAAVDVATYLVSRDAQLRMSRDGGQPAHLSAWTERHGVGINGTFFEECRAMQTGAILRPRYARYIEMQKGAGAILRDDAMSQARPAQLIVDDLEAMFAETREI